MEAYENKCTKETGVWESHVNGRIIVFFDRKLQKKKKKIHIYENENISSDQVALKKLHAEVSFMDKDVRHKSIDYWTLS